MLNTPRLHFLGKPRLTTEGYGERSVCQKCQKFFYCQQVHVVYTASSSIKSCLLYQYFLMASIGYIKMIELSNKQPNFLEIDQETAGQRIDNFLINKLKGVPRDRVYSMLRKGEVRVDKKRVKPMYRLEEGNKLRIPPVRVPTAVNPFKPSDRLLVFLKSCILFEDDDLLVINKPSGLAVHGGSGVHLGIIEGLRALYPKEKALELVHRLDKETSGCLMIAKKRAMLRELHTLLREGKVNKQYTALLCGKFSAKRQEIKAPLLKNQLSSGERIVKISQAGKEALTIFHHKKTFKTATLVEAELRTGRTHQIRVHATYMGHPVVGDEKYGDNACNADFRRLGLKRLFLHASSLAFCLPSGKRIQVDAPLGPELLIILNKLSI